jgi:hypothetical protein
MFRIIIMSVLLWGTAAADVRFGAGGFGARYAYPNDAEVGGGLELMLGFEHSRTAIFGAARMHGHDGLDPSYQVALVVDHVFGETTGVVASIGLGCLWFDSIFSDALTVSHPDFTTGGTWSMQSTTAEAGLGYRWRLGDHRIETRLNFVWAGDQTLKPIKETFGTADRMRLALVKARAEDFHVLTAGITWLL